MRMWLIARKKHKIESQLEKNVDAAGGFSESSFAHELEEPLREMDIPVPVILPKHIKELAKFSMTTFKADDFVEAVPFDRLEVSLIDDKKVDKPVYNPLYD